MFPQEWTTYGIFGYRTRWCWGRRSGWWLAIGLSLGLWVMLVYTAIGLVG